MSGPEKLFTALKDAFAQKESFLQKRSAVHFVPELMELLFSGRLSREEFSRHFVSILNDVKFYLAVMPEEDRKEYQRTERREFIFTDQLNKVAVKCAELDDEAFMQEILSCMRNYINSPEV